jgi:hypothetical protein
MPVLNIFLSEADHKKLVDDYEKMSQAWVQQGRQSLPPPFEHWVGVRMMATTPISAEDVEHMRVFSAIEKLVTSLQPHGFCLAHLADQATPPAKSSLELAQALAHHFGLPAQYVKRLQDVFAYYLKNAGSLLEGGDSATTLHASHTLELAYQDFLERTTKALDHLGSERAIGRIEGALALLVSLHVMKRDVAQEKTAAFKLQARGGKK